jgi:hypothetical protein
VTEAWQLWELVRENPNASLAAIRQRRVADGRRQQRKQTADPGIRQLGIARVILQDHGPKQSRPSQSLRDRKTAVGIVAPGVGQRRHHVHMGLECRQSQATAPILDSTKGRAVATSLRLLGYRFDSP